MSGGYLDYFYSRFDEPLEKISKEIKCGKNKWSPEVLLEFQNAIKYLKIAQVYSHMEYIDKESFEKRIADASDCYDFEEIDNEVALKIRGK